MAFVIKSKLYRVAIDNERTFIFVCANNTEDLIRYLAAEYAGKREIFGAKEIQSDGTLMTATVVTNPLFKELFVDADSAVISKKHNVDDLISRAMEKSENFDIKQAPEKTEKSL